MLSAGGDLHSTGEAAKVDESGGLAWVIDVLREGSLVAATTIRWRLGNPASIERYGISPGATANVRRCVDLVRH